MKKTSVIQTAFSAVITVFCISAVKAQLSDTCVRVSPDSIYVYMDSYAKRQLPQLTLDNRNGKTRVNYSASISYFRSVVDMDETPKPTAPPATAKPEPDTLAITLQYESKSLLGYEYGVVDAESQTFATKYTAGVAGFRIYSVGTWFTGAPQSEGVIRVEIRAGGNSIDDAVPLAVGELRFSVKAGEENGKMYAVPVSSQAAVISPGEDFYVLVTYPSEQSRPQGCAMNPAVRQAAGRYLVKTGKGWQDLQRISGFSRCAWLMSVTGTEHENFAWLEFTSSPSGTLLRGQSVSLRLKTDRAPLLKGRQTAHVHVTVGDSCHTSASIPVTLHLNEAPFFRHAPVAVYIPENEKRDYKIILRDNENDSYQVRQTGGAKVASYKLSDSVLTLTVAPVTGDAGHYNVRLLAVDGHGESRELTVPIHVTVLKQLYGSEGFTYPFMGKSAEYRIRDLFSYKNGDGFLFTASSRDENVLKLEQTDDSTIIATPLYPGSTAIDFRIWDGYGNDFRHSIPVAVGQCEDPSLIVVQKWNRVLLANNSLGKYSGYQWYKNREEIAGADRQYFDAGEQLDFAAYYHVRLVTVSGDTVYSCPITPMFKNADAKVYPNPVSAGSVLNIETGFPDTGTTEEIRVSLTDALGRTAGTGSFCGATGIFQVPQTGKGFYTVTVSCKNATRTFNIFVK
jgi:hypothetical protein